MDHRQTGWLYHTMSCKLGFKRKGKSKLHVSAAQDLETTRYFKNNCPEPKSVQIYNDIKQRNSRKS